MQDEWLERLSHGEWDPLPLYNLFLKENSFQKAEDSLEARFPKFTFVSELGEVIRFYVLPNRKLLVFARREVDIVHDADFHLVEMKPFMGIYLEEEGRIQLLQEVRRHPASRRIRLPSQVHQKVAPKII